MKHIVENIHFVGIGGTGINGIAGVLLNLGYRVTGPDLGSSTTTQRPATLGATTMQGYAPERVIGANAVVVSTAVRGDNPEVLAARARRIPIVPHAVMLAELMRLKQGIAIAGTHGKTTTAGLIASVLAEDGLDPTFAIGDRLNSASASARLGTGDSIVAETDEPDASFLNLFPVIEAITNTDTDHMDTYGRDFARLKQAFIEFMQRLPLYGIAVLCVGDPNVREILPFVSKPIVCYRFAEDAQVRAVNAHAVDGRMEFTVIRQLNGHAELPLLITLNLPGLHNVQNALAAIVIATELEVPDEAIIKALAEFNGVGRRFQRYDEVSTADGKNRFTLINDYGHRPVEMAATLAAACSAFPGRRLALSFQSHRFTHTHDCFEDFIKVLGTVDTLLLVEVYAAGEPPIIAADGRILTRALRMTSKIEPVLVEQIEDMPQAIIDATQDGDVVITIGTGSIGQVPGQVVALQVQTRTANVVDLNGGAAA